MHKHPHTTDAEFLQQSLRFFPDFSDAQRARWMEARRYIQGRFTIPIGELAVDHTPPDFLRALPRPQFLTIERSKVSEYLRELRRIAEGKLP